MKAIPLFCRFVLGLLGTLTIPVAYGGGTVYELTHAALEAALVGGGTVVFANSGTLLVTNTLVISQDTTLEANGNDVTLSGGGNVRLLKVTEGVTLSIKGLTLADGWFAGANAPDGHPAPDGEDGLGGGILSLGGALVLENCTLSNHTVQGGNAGRDPVDGNSNLGRGGKGFGGAICGVGGTVSLTNCVLSGNRAIGGRGSADPPDPLAYYVGDSGPGWGGAVYVEGGRLNLEGVTASTNVAAGGTAERSEGVYELFGRGGEGAGGALFVTNSILYVGESVLAGNVAVGGGNTNAISGSGMGAGAANGGALLLAQGASGTIRVSMFRDNSATGAPGVRHQYRAGSGQGGAVCNRGVLELFDSTFSKNSGLGGSCLEPGAGQGGAIYSTNRLAVSGCTFEQNLTQGGVGYLGVMSFPGAQGEGGALWSSGELRVTNSTCAANRALAGYGIPPGEARGGAVYVAGGSAVLVSATLAANEVLGGAAFPTQPRGASQGGGVANTNGTVTVYQSIIANNPSGGDFWGQVTDGGYNFCSDGTGRFLAPGSFNSGDPLLSALSYNGGPTATFSLLAGSPARDAVPNTMVLTDQRGVVRPQGPAADIGAYEADYLPAAPSILTHPKGTTARAGTNVTFTVVAAGAGTLHYQWKKDGDPIDGATTNNLALTNVQAADAGTYTVLVTNTAGSKISDGAVLVVDSKPLLLTQPEPAVVSPGTGVTFSVVADGPSLSYQWYHDGVLVSGATHSSLEIDSALAGAQGVYWVVVSNFADVVTSEGATLEFNNSALNILVPPKERAVEAGYPVTFDVLVSGIPPFHYQWRHGGEPIPGATERSFTIARVESADAGNYSVVVTNGYRMLTSSTACLTVTPGPVAPVMAAGCVGDNLAITFTAEAGCSYRLLSSSDLTNWTPVATNSTVTAGPLQFIQPLTDVPQLYYKISAR